MRPYPKDFAMEEEFACPQPREVWDDEPEIEPWSWRRLRSIGRGVQFWPVEWGFYVFRHDDTYGGRMGAQIGPLLVSLDYNDGSEMGQIFKG